MSPASTPTKTPVASKDGSQSPVRSLGRELSPWSKIRAEILGSESSPKPTAETRPPTNNNNGSQLSQDESHVPKRRAPKRFMMDEDSSDSDVAPRRPVGRMAARLMGAEGGSDDQKSEGDSYARVKRLLMGRKDRDPSEEAVEDASGADQPSEELQADPESNRRTSASSPGISGRLSASPRLFVSPDRPAATAPIHHDAAAHSNSDSDAMPSSLIGNERFQALVAQKRAERLAKESEQKAKEAEKRAKISREVEQLGKILSEEVDDEEDRGARRSLAKQSRPARKASKKALEEMSRETQRLARNQQLTHQAMVKKKFTTQDLFKRFNYRQESSPAKQPGNPTDDEYVMSGALISSDAEGQKAKDTPPSSPPSVVASQNKDVETLNPLDRHDIVLDVPMDENLDEELPTLEEVMTRPVAKIDKGKAPMKIEEVQTAQHPVQKKPGEVKKYRIPSPRKSRNADDSDDDIEIVGKPRFAVFDKIPVKKNAESHSLLNLRALAHLKSPSKVTQKSRKSLTPAELQLQLQQRAQKQVLREKQERIADLRAKGMVIQTEEEKEQEQLEIENLLEKARQEAQELAKREKEAAAKEGQPVPEGFGDSDDEADGEYLETADDESAEEHDIELSGSEEETVDGDDEDGDEEGEEDMNMEAANPFIDNAAEDDDAEDDGRQTNTVSEQRSNEDDEDLPAVPANRETKNRRRFVIEDDEEEEESLAEQTPIQSKTPQPAQSSAAAAFGFKTPQAGQLGLTQMFAGTMADLESQSGPSQTLNYEEDSLTLLREIPMATLPEPDNFQTSNILVRDSQQEEASPEESMPVMVDFGLSQFPSQAHATLSPTKLSEMPEPTQDAGFDLSRTPAILTAAPHSTVETVVLPTEESPVVQRRGRLHRRTEASVVLTDDEGTIGEDAGTAQSNDFQLSTTAFDVLFKAAKKPQPPGNDFDKKRSEAKNMFEEQAEESEDEYAGLGGASDEDSDNEIDEEVQKMMDDSHVELNERKLAQLYADKERASDEKAIDKLYKDIATGALRRKRGANFDDLSEDEDDAAEERRRRKQLEFARMRKALLEDENIGKIAENPKKMAFLRAIEDRDEDGEMDFLGDGDMFVDSVPDSQAGEEANASPREENVDEDNHSEADEAQEKTAPAVAKVDTSTRMSHRRPGADKSMSRPTTIAEIRESLSFLVEDTVIPDSQRVDSESDGEDEMDTDRPAESRPVLGTIRPSVVNRLSTVTRIDDEEKPDGPMAFHAPNSATSSVFKVPLLRRGTNLSTTSSSSGGTTTPTTETGVRMGGSKKSNIHYQAREAERRKIVEAAERKRKEEVKKSVIGKGRSSVLGALGRSTGFE